MERAMKGVWLGVLVESLVGSLISSHEGCFLLS
jgi:hypothetical protein